MNDASSLPKPSMPGVNPGSDANGVVGAPSTAAVPQSPPIAQPVAPAPAAAPVAVSAPTSVSAQPVAAPPQPAVAPAPFAQSAASPLQQSQEPVIQSSLLRNLQNVSAIPFQDPSLSGAGALPNTSSSSGLNTAALPATAATTGLPTSTGIPQESASMGAAAVEKGGAGATKSPSSSGATTASAAQPAKLGMFAKMGKTVWLAAGGVALLLLAVGALAWTFLLQPEATPVGSPSGSGANTARTVTLTYWGLWEPVEVMQPLIDAYQKQNPGVTIKYTQQNSRQYRQRLQTAIDDGSGPDIFRYHNTWVPMFRTQLAAAPTRVFPATELEQNFYPIMSNELVMNDQALGVPLMYEGLALLYNKSILESANALPPQDWNELRQLANQLTIRRDNRIERAGIALGTAENVDHFSDILGLMLLQNGANPGNPTTENAQAALEFYTLFSRGDNVWDTTMPNSTVAFANEQVVMIFAPSWRIHEIQELNPNIEIGVTQVPQLGGEDVAWGTYWVEGVSKKSAQSEEAWKFLSYLAQAEQLRTFHSQAASLRGYGELYPRVDMAASLANNPELSPYLADALYASSWHMAGATYDEGLNDQIIKYYIDAVNMVRTNGKAADALNSIAPGITQVLSRFGVSLPPGAVPAAAPTTTAPSSGL